MENTDTPAKALLKNLNSLCKQANKLQHAGIPIPDDLWSDLYAKSQEVDTFLAQPTNPEG
jgi:hypothetical protein